MNQLFEDRQYALSALEVKNVKGVRAVALKFDTDKDMFVIGGENEAGKTSTIDALWYAIAGARNIPEKPIREGERKAEVVVTLNDKATGKPHLKAKRSWWYSKKGHQLRTKLELTDPNGVEVPGGAQTILDRLYSHLLDPTEFLNYDRAKKVEAVRELVGIDFSELDTERKTVYAKRTEANRKREELRARFDAAKDYPEAEGKTLDDVDVSGLLDKQEAAAKAERQKEELQRKAEKAKETAAGLRERITANARKVEELKAEIAELEKSIASMGVDETDFLNDAKEFEATAEAVVIPEVGDVKEAIAEAESLKEKIRANMARDEIGKQLDAADAEATKHDDRIHEIDEEKAKRLKEADFPIEGLSFDEDAVYFNGKPLDQCSTSEQIRVSLAMALANPPKLPVMFIRRSESLDAKRLKMIADTAHKAGALVIAERVSTGPECDVIIEDGRVRDGDEPTDKPEPEEPKPARPATPEEGKGTSGKTVDPSKDSIADIEAKSKAEKQRKIDEGVYDL